MKLYNFRQNNSGGAFIINNNVSVNVTIEADSYKKANKKAKEVGIYFNGCNKLMDCSCCGDRWDKLNSYLDDREADNYSTFKFTDKEEALEYFQGEYNKENRYSVNRVIYFKDDTKEVLDNGER